MEITATINLTAAEQKQLAKILGCQQDKLAETLRPYASAALTELTTMVLGKKVFTRGSDILEHRLFLLIQHAFGNKVPSEQQVSRLFQTTTTGSRAILRAVMSKYQYELQTAITSSLSQLIQAATKGEDDVRTISVLNVNFVDALNLILVDADPTLPPVSKRQGSVSTYVIPASSFEALAKKLGA